MLFQAKRSRMAAKKKHYTSVAYQTFSMQMKAAAQVHIVQT
jgi:hypothetical protein